MATVGDAAARGGGDEELFPDKPVQPTRTPVQELNTTAARSLRMEQLFMIAFRRNIEVAELLLNCLDLV